MKSQELNARLSSEGVEDIYDALIDVGKEGHRELADEVARFLEHSQSTLREGAIRVLGFYWKDARYRSVAERMMACDPDAGVRAVALMAWAAYYAGTRDTSVMRRLFDILRDPKEDEELRANAYPCLLSVSGLPKPQWPQRLSVYGDIENQVDWALLHALMAESEGHAS